MSRIPALTISGMALWVVHREIRQVDGYDLVAKRDECSTPGYGCRSASRIDCDRSNPSTARSASKAIESLGLKLERRQVPLEVVIVDKISRTPTEN